MWKSFAVVKQNCNLLENIHGWAIIFVWPKPIAQVISLEKFCSYQSICENCKTFPVWMICNIWYQKPGAANIIPFIININFMIQYKNFNSTKHKHTLEST